MEKPSENAFLPEDPTKILQSGAYNKVPLLIGYNDAEGILSVTFTAATGNKPIHKDFEDLVVAKFDLDRGSEKSKRVARKIKDFYYGNKEPSLDTLETFVQVS